VNGDDDRDDGSPRPGRVRLLEGQLTDAAEASPPTGGASPPRYSLRPSVELFEAPDGATYLLRPGAGDLVVRAPDDVDRRLLRRLAAEPAASREELLSTGAGVDDKLAALDRAGVLLVRVPGPALDPPDAERFDRQLPYFAEHGDPAAIQRRLRAAHVVILGCGGLGTWALTALASAGVGAFTLADDDVVDRSNLNRQIAYSERDVGAGKAERAAAWVQAFDGSIDVRVVPRRVAGAGDVRALVDGASALVQAADHPPYELARWVDAACIEAGVPWIAAGQVPPLVKIGPLYVPGRICFACHERQLRRESPHYDALVAQRRAEGARPATTLGPASGIVGTMLAMEVVHRLTGVARPATEACALILDLRTLELRRQPITPDTECSSCRRG
jgi:bacteriocin biosynthesis cyclodehydratase domain-containing protein